MTKSKFNGCFVIFRAKPDYGDGSALAAGISPVSTIPRTLDSVRQRYRAALLMLSNR
jgi:hypothetical protein